MKIQILTAKTLLIITFISIGKILLYHATLRAQQRLNKCTQEAVTYTKIYKIIINMIKSQMSNKTSTVTNSYNRH